MQLFPPIIIGMLAFTLTITSVIAESNESPQENQSANAMVVGVQPLALTVTEKSVMPTGLSVTKSVLNQTVYNAQNEKVGRVEDLILSLDKQVTFAIVGAGGFLGLGRHLVAVPVRFFQMDEDKKRLMLPNGTKDQLMSLPKFRYK